MSIVPLVKSQLRRFSDSQIRDLESAVKIEIQRRLKAEIQTEQARGQNVAT